MTLVRSLLFEVCFYVLMAVMGIALAPVALVSRSGAYWAIKLYFRICFRLLDWICGLKIRVEGEPPQGAALVVAKHQSMLDVLILFVALPRAKFVMKREILWMPFFGWYAWRVGQVAIDRRKGGKAMPGMVKDLESQSDEAGQTVIYPQGTRVAPGTHLPYKSGASVLYERFGLPATLVATNAGHFWGRASLRRRPGTAVVRFFETLPAGLGRSAFMERIETEIEAETARLSERVSPR